MEPTTETTEPVTTDTPTTPTEGDQGNETPRARLRASLEEAILKNKDRRQPHQDRYSMMSFVLELISEILGIPMNALRATSKGPILSRSDEMIEGETLEISTQLGTVDKSFLWMQFSEGLWEVRGLEVSHKDALLVQAFLHVVEHDQTVKILRRKAQLLKSEKEDRAKYQAQVRKVLIVCAIAAFLASGASLIAYLL